MVGVNECPFLAASTLVLDTPELAFLSLSMRHGRLMSKKVGLDEL